MSDRAALLTRIAKVKRETCGNTGRSREIMDMCDEFVLHLMACICNGGSGRNVANPRNETLQAECQACAKKKQQAQARLQKHRTGKGVKSLNRRATAADRG